MSNKHRNSKVRLIVDGKLPKLPIQKLSILRLPLPIVMILTAILSPMFAGTQAAEAYTAATGYTTSQSSVPSWRILTQSSLGGINTGVFDGISCPSAGNCVAIGGNSEGSTLLVTSNGGTSWTTRSESSTTTQVGNLDAVSCPSISVCVSTGAGLSGSDSGIALTTANDGASWTFVAAPPSSGELYGVSCPSTAICFAVGTLGGSNFGKGGTILESNDSGNSWKLVYSTSGIDAFYGISCPSTSDCYAVGYSGFNAVSMVVATVDAGANWNKQAVPDNSSGAGPFLDAISCPTASVCFATTDSVPFGAPGANPVILATTDGGAKWAYQSPPQYPNPSGNDLLLSISCPTAYTCFAGGYGPLPSNGSGSPPPVILSTSDGGVSWEYDSLSSSIPSVVNGVTSISCPDVSVCFAAGYYNESSGGTAGAVLGTGQSATTPIITGVSPASASVSGGIMVTIFGNNLSNATTVDFGNTPASSFTVISSDEISAAVPQVPSPGIVNVSVTTGAGTSPTVASSGFVYVDTGLRYVPLAPYRILDTRCASMPSPTYCASENLPQANAGKAAPSADSSIIVQVTGTGSGSDAIPTSAQSVVMNVTAVTSSQSHSGYLTVYPASTSVPLASSLNYTPSDTVANLVTATIGANGQIAVFSNTGELNVVIDIEGYYDNASTAGLTYMPVMPTRLLDTRCAESPLPPSISQTYCNSLPGVNAVVDAPGPNSYISMQIAGYGSIPVSATAVTLNITAVDPTASGYISALPSIPGTAPTSSSVNFKQDHTVANAVTIPLSSTGTVTVYNYTGTTQVVVDVSGYFSNSPSGMTFTPNSPERICDTRPQSTSGISDQCTAKTIPSGGGTISVQVAGAGGIPSNAVAMVANTTAIPVSTSAGYLTVWPSSTTTSIPQVSNINWTGAGQVTPNMVTAELGASSGSVNVYASTGSDVIIDIVGWYV